MDKKIETYNQPTATPTAKVSATLGAGVVVSLVVALLAQFGVIIPDNVSAQAESAMVAIVILITFGQTAVQFLAGYLKKSERK